MQYSILLSALYASMALGKVLLVAINRFLLTCTQLSWLHLLITPLHGTILAQTPSSGPPLGKQFMFDFLQEADAALDSTDPSTMNIVLVNNVVNPSTQTTIASNVQTSSGSYTVSSLIGNGAGYQVNLMATTNSQILAQSGQFTLSNTSPASGGGSSSSASIFSSTSSSAASSSSTSLTSSKIEFLQA